MLDYRFRDVHRYARASGFVSGFSTLEEGLVDERWLEYQAVLIPDGEGRHQPVSRSDLSNPDFGNFGQMFRAAHRYAQSQGFESGFPAFEQSENQLGITLLGRGLVDVAAISTLDLGVSSFADLHVLFNAVHRYARNLNAGYISGYPLFEEGFRDGVLHYGVGLIKAAATFKHVPADLLAMYGRDQEPATGFLVLIAHNGVPASAGRTLKNDSSRPATLAAGTVAMTVPSGAEAGVSIADNSKPCDLIIFDIQPNAIPAETGRIALAPGDATRVIVLSDGGGLTLRDT